MTWSVRDDGSDMVLSGQVPAAIRTVLGGNVDAILHGDTVDEISLWAVHPGGRSVLDAVQRTLNLSPDALAPSREVLRDNGNAPAHRADARGRPPRHSAWCEESLAVEAGVERARAAPLSLRERLVREVAYPPPTPDTLT